MSIRYWVVSRPIIHSLETKRSGPYEESQLEELVLSGRIHRLSLIDVEPPDERFRAEDLPFLEELFARAEAHETKVVEPRSHWLGYRRFLAVTLFCGFVAGWLEEVRTEGLSAMMIAFLLLAATPRMAGTWPRARR